MPEPTETTSAPTGPVDDVAVAREATKEDMLQWFAFAHLPPHLQAISRTFAEVAIWMATTLPRNPERTAGLRKLVEAKDCAVRAQLFKPHA